MYGMRKRLVSLFHFLVLVFCFVGFMYVWRVKFNDSHCVWCVEFINYYCVRCARLADHYCVRLIIRMHFELLFHFSALVSPVIGFLYVWCIQYSDGHCVWCAEFINYYFVRCSRTVGHYRVKLEAQVASNIILMMVTCSVIVWQLLLK